MAIYKFSQFKKERVAIREAKAKEAATKKYTKMFNEKLKEFGVSNPSELSEEDQIKFYDSLKPVSESVETEEEKIDEKKAEESKHEEEEKAEESNCDDEEEEEEEAKLEESTINEADIKDEASFRKYAEDILKKAHGDDYDEAKAKKMIDDIAKKYGEDGDWGDAVGVVQQSLA